MFESANLLAFGFANLALLGWLAAALTPWIIHLWNKRKYRETSWAAMHLLVAAVRQNARRIQLRHWLLLAVRTAIILLVVIALAGPYLQQSGLQFIAGQRTHKVLVIDGSYSMAYLPTDHSRFVRAKQLASQIVEESSRGDAFTLVLLAEPPRVIVGTPAFEPTELLKEIDALRLPHAGADLPATIEKISEVLDHAARETARLDRTEVYFLTDLGRNTWVPDLEGGKAEEAFRRQVGHLAGRAELIVLDLGQPNCENLAITALRQTQAFATTKSQVSFEATVRNFGNQLRSHQVAELLVDGEWEGEAKFDIQPGGKTTVSFSHRFDLPGTHVVQVRLGPDLLDVDNRRWLSVPVKSHLSVLCVSGRQGSTHYLASALEPDPMEESMIRAEVVPETAILEMDLDRYDCLFLSNVAQFTTDEARVLKSYLAEGGGLVFFLGDRVMPDRYNWELAGEGPERIRVLPVRLGELVEEAQYAFDPLDYRHPIVSPFRGQEQAGLLTTPIFRYFRLIMQKEWPNARVALAFAGGDPAIVEEPLYGGRSILFATAGSLASTDPVTRTPWTTMPAWPSFVPIVHELLAMAVRSRGELLNALVGETIGAPIGAARIGIPLVVRAPNGAIQPVRGDRSSNPPRWTYDATGESGVYRLEENRAERTATTDPVASGLTVKEAISVNPNTVESDLTKAEEEELVDSFLVQSDWQSLDRQVSPTISRRTGLHRLLLYLALGLVFLETSLAWKFGQSV